MKEYLERKYLGTLSRIGHKIGIQSSKIRIFFIYSVFATLGISFLLYPLITLLFWIKDCIIIKRPSVFDL